MTVDAPTLALFGLLASPSAAALLALVPNDRVSEASARGGSLAAFLSAVFLLASGTSGQWGAYLGLDPLSAVFLIMVTGIYATSSWYSKRYLRSVHQPFLTPQVYYALVSAFAFSMVFTLVVSDLGLMWIGVEATTVASALLIVLERKPSSVEAAWRYTLIASAGLTIALFALLLLYTSTGTLNAFALAARPPPATLPVEMAVALALVGYGTKVGLFPMHTWLPDAHSEAPSPVSAMFSGVLLPTALYAFLRVYRVLPAPAPASIRYLLLAFGIATALVAAFLVQRQRSYKRLLAYSSMEVMGIAVVGVAIGGVALYGALLLLLAHAFAKSAAFYCAGNVLRATGTSKIDELSGVGRSMPWTGAGWLLSAAAVTGAPPFGTFLGELLIVVGSFEAGLPWVGGVVAVAILIAFLGVNSQIGRIVLGDPTPRAIAVGAEREGGFGVAYLNLGVALAIGIASLPYLSRAVVAAASLLGGRGP